MRARWSRPVDYALMAAAAACLLLAAVRLADNISLHAPLQLTTSGAEEEALFSIWSFAHGQPVYTDPLAVPYTASYFNWLFYDVYGSVAGFTLRLLHLDDAWLPTVCRLLTLALAAAGGGVFFGTLRRSDRSDDLSPRAMAALAVLALFNPLCGLWLITARPDLGAAALELAGLAFFFRYLREERLKWIALTALALYGAWGFKQTALSALAAVALSLLLLRRGRALLLLVMLWLGGVAGALAAFGPDYRHGLYLSQIHSEVHLAWGITRFLTAASKMPFIFLALAALPFLAWRGKLRGPHHPAERTALLAVLAALLLEVVTSCKGGAADYYFIPLGLWSTLWLVLAARRIAPLWRNRGLLAAAGLTILGVAAVFCGWRGTLDCRDPRQPFQHLAAYLAARPGPVYVQSAYGSLPWISPTAPHFVVAYNYRVDREAGVRFERDGWQGLLTDGYFSTVVTEADSSEIGGALLARYRFVREEAGLRYFERK